MNEPHRPRVLGLVVAIVLAALASAASAQTPAPSSASPAPPGSEHVPNAAAPPAAPLTAAPAVGSSFTYQGVLKSGGAVVNATCDFAFRLFDDPDAGYLVASPLSRTLAVTGGLFTADLDFGMVFTGDVRWLDVQVGCPSGGVLTQVTPRQRLAPAPYAVSLAPGAEVAASLDGDLLLIENTSTSGGHAVKFVNHDDISSAVYVQNYGDAVGLSGWSQSGTGVGGASASGTGVSGVHLAPTGTDPGVVGTTESSDANAVAIQGKVNSVTPGASSVAVKGTNNGTGNAGIGVWGSQAGSGYGVYGGTVSGYGVFGDNSAGGRGVFGRSVSGAGVYATSAGAGINNAALVASNTLTGAEPSGIAIYAKNQSADTTLVVRNTSTGDVVRAINAAGTELTFRITNSGQVRADGSYNCGLASGCFNTGAGADLAERIDSGEALAAGDVVEIDPDEPGHYRRSRSALSPLVAGVVSTSPAITMSNNDLTDVSAERTDTRPLIALVGVVPVKASAENGPIRAGDLLAAAGTPGHAMRAGTEPPVGTVIGKALAPLAAGTGTVQMLVMLR